MHPLLVPGAWLFDGSYHPAGKPVQIVTGVTEVHASEEFPETLRVEGEVREANDPAARPVCSTYYLDVTGHDRIRFRMNSQPLATVLVGEGFFDDISMVVHYSSPERRILGFESYVAGSTWEMRTSGVLLADGVVVTSWIARLERIEAGARAR